MRTVFNLEPQKRKRRNLRNRATVAERILWQKIRNSQIGYKFRRQHGIKQYIVDFYCPKLKLVVEIDGDTHSTNEEIIYDYKRQKVIENLGLKVKRYNNSDIKKNAEAVLEDLQRMCKKIENSGK